MNKDVTIDDALLDVFKATGKEQSVTFLEDEMLTEGTIEEVLEHRIKVMMQRKTLSPLDVTFLGVLLENRPEGGY